MPDVAITGPGTLAAGSGPGCPSLQNTIFVLSGCRVRPMLANRRPTASRTSKACLSVTQ